jgi:hypothetical protein
MMYGEYDEWKDRRKLMVVVIEAESAERDGEKYPY